VVTFWKILTDPQGPWVKKELLTPDFLPWQRLHYFSHYADSVIEKGALPSYSTDRTEIHHKPFKMAWQMSNKNGLAETIVLKEVVRLSAFQDMVGMIEAYEDTDDTAATSGSSELTSNSGVTTAETLASREPLDHVRESLEEENLREEDADEGEASTVPAGLGITWPKLSCRGLRGRV
jgi:hypothetical protein